MICYCMWKYLEKDFLGFCEIVIAVALAGLSCVKFFRAGILILG